MMMLMKIFFNNAQHLHNFLEQDHCTNFHAKINALSAVPEHLRRGDKFLVPYYLNAY